MKNHRSVPGSLGRKKDVFSDPLLFSPHDSSQSRLLRPGMFDMITDMIRIMFSKEGVLLKKLRQMYKPAAG